jgi:hypothetical protein
VVVWFEEVAQIERHSKARASSKVSERTEVIEAESGLRPITRRASGRDDCSVARTAWPAVMWARDSVSGMSRRMEQEPTISPM